MTHHVSHVSGVSHGTARRHEAAVVHVEAALLQKGLLLWLQRLILGLDEFRKNYSFNQIKA